MQKKIISIILCAALLVPLTACGTVSDSTPTDSGLTSNVESSETVSTEETVSSELVSSNAASSEETQSEDVSEVSSALTSSAKVDSTNPASAEEEASEPQQPDKSIDFSISTSQTTSGFDDTLCSIATEKGIVINNDNETLSFTASASVCKEIANEYKDYFINQPESETSTIKKIFINDSYDIVEFYVTSDYENSMDALGILLFSHVMTTLQLLSGKDYDSVCYTNRVINIETNEIISETILPDDLEQ